MSGAEKTWWHRPRLRTAEPGDEPRKVTWLELFYDLVFVIVIAEISHRLSGEITPMGILHFTFLFITTWWVWVAGTYYMEYWETDDVSVRVIKFLLMVPVVGLAVFIHGAFEDRKLGFVVCYGLARLVLALMFLRVGVHDRQSRTIAWSYSVSFSVVAVIVAASLGRSRAAIITLFSIAAAIEMLTPLAVSVSVKTALPHRRRTSKLPERFGLFTIIVLGETFVGVFQGLSEAHRITAAYAKVGLMGLAIAFALWSVYFDFVARRAVKEGTRWEHAWGYSHLLLLMCIVAVGACLSHVVASGEAPLVHEVAWLLAGATGVGLFAIALLETTLETDDAERRAVTAGVLAKVVIGVAAIGTGFAGKAVGAGALLGILLTLLVVPVVLGVRLWIRERTAH